MGEEGGFPRSVLARLAVVAFTMLCNSGFSAETQSLSLVGPVFGIAIVDDLTSRGVPLVELETVNHVRYYTDSSGVCAIDDPDLMNRKVFFHIRSHGYEFPADGFGYRGKALEVKPGAEVTLAIKRLNVAERLYRVTGEGIYRDTVLLGRQAPVAHALVSGLVAGQDSVQSIVYRGKIYWFWGDTNRLSYPLGHFGTAGATSELPGKGGLDPSVGVNLTYFVDANGFSRPVCDVPGKGPKWIDGLMLLKDETGRERLVAKYIRVKSLGETLERGLIIFNDDTATFEPLVRFPLDAPLYPSGHPFRRKVAGVEYYYFPNAYPLVRVKADLPSVKNPSAYEAFTCLAAENRYDKAAPKLDRDRDGRLVWSWKTNTDLVGEKRQTELIDRGKITPEEGWFRMRDVETSEPVHLHFGSVCFNEYRRRWIMIAVESHGKPSNLGEVWYSEADAPEGPWLYARKILTHDRYSFYNPKQHPFFDQDGGRLIYFEGTYATTFSRQDDATPRYDYNQIMYRLDLSDSRLRLPSNQNTP